jgi:predicted nucleotide-binding protein
MRKPLVTVGREVLVPQGTQLCHANGCYAVVIMTGDDKAEDGQRRTREKVMHEVGYFQAKFGLASVCHLHAEGVSIPSNIHGPV